jgi:PIN domain nuclease of toxin-antitoxin system
MRLLLDTHILIWWQLDRPELPAKYRTILETAEAKQEKFCLSVISLWEIAKLESSKRIQVLGSVDTWLEELESHSSIEILPLNSRIILESTRLGDGFHKDPADQLIAATARCHGLKLITVDERIRSSGVVAIA